MLNNKILVYNMPIASDRYRPQELNINNSIDGYEVVVSCVASNGMTSPVIIDVNEDDELFARYNNDLIPNIELSLFKLQVIITINFLIILMLLIILLPVDMMN